MGGDSKFHGNMLCLFCVAVLCCVAYVSPVLPDTCSDHPDGSCTGAAMSELLSAAAAAAGSIGGGGSVWVVCSRSACIKRNTQSAKRKTQTRIKMVCLCLFAICCLLLSVCVCVRARACVCCLCARTGASRSDNSPIGEVLLAYKKNASLFECCFPAFVPSLSWQVN
jgi:hypothetical protein